MKLVTYKSYGNIKAVKRINFYVDKGTIFAFLGQNGAGKSTTIDMLCTFLKSDSGNVNVNGNNIGFDDDKIRNDLGIIFQDGLLDSLLSVKDNLKIRGSLYGLRGDKLDCAVNDVASMTCIKQYLNRPYGKLSGGQK